MGVDWRDKFFASLSEDDQNEIKFLQPQNRVKFGKKIQYLCYLSGKKTILIANAVK